VTGDLVWYEIARRGGHRVLKWLGRFLDRAGHVRSACRRRGASALVIGKVVPGFNGIVQPLAGALGMSRLRFLIFDVVGNILWFAVYLGLGYALHDQLAEAILLASRLGLWALVIVGGAFTVCVSVSVMRRRFVLRRLRIASNCHEPETFRRCLSRVLKLRGFDSSMIPSRNVRGNRTARSREPSNREHAERSGAKTLVRAQSHLWNRQVA
jgi:hypothetical protein